MTAALTDPTDYKSPTTENFDPSLWWQQRDKQRNQVQQTNQVKDAVSPVADTIGLDQFTSRLQPIKDIGAKALQGQLISTQYQRQQEQARQAAALAASQTAAQRAAWNSANQYQPTSDGTSGGAAGWGSGGAQGVANVLRAAGFPEYAIPTMMGIAYAESGWNPSAVNNSNRNGSVDNGLFQINTIHKGNSWYPTDVNDPLQSAKAAYAIWQGAGQTYRDWSVYNSGAYKQYVPAQAPPIIQAATVNTGGTTVAQGNGTLRQVAIQKATAYMASGVGYVWGGENLATGVDCSGLVMEIYKQLGFNFPHSAQQIAFSGQKTSVANLQVGDLVAFNNGGDRGLQVGHIAIYAGNNQIIESYSSGMPARRRNLTATEANLNAGVAFGVHLNF